MKKILSLLLIFVVTVSLFSSTVSAGSDDPRDDVLLARDEVINRDYFSAGEVITLSGIVNGDAYMAGESVIVDGTVNGDILAAGRKVEIRGVVTGDVRVAGERVIVTGKIGGNLTVGAAEVELESSAAIAGSIVAGASEMNIAASVGKGITAGVGKMRVEKYVGGDVNYWSDAELALGPDASVSGTVSRHAIPQNEKPAVQSAAYPFAGFQLISTIGFFILGWLFLRLMPSYTSSALDRIREKPLLSFFVGFCAVIVAPVTIFLGFVSILGIPLAVFGLLTFLLVCLVAKYFAALVLGTFILKYFNPKFSSLAALAIGLILTSLLMLIPVVGWLVAGGVFLISLGGLILHHRDFYLALRGKKLV